MITYGLAIIIGLFVVYLGVSFLFAPYAAAAGYGVPVQPPGDSAYLAVKGVRDLSLGVIALLLLAFAGAEAAGWYMLGAAIIPLGDTVIVLRHGGRKVVAFGIHFATAVVVLLSAALLLAA